MKRLENCYISKSQQKDIHERIEEIYFAVENGDYEELAVESTIQKANARLKEIKKADKDEGIEETLTIIKHIVTDTKNYSVY